MLKNKANRWFLIVMLLVFYPIRSQISMPNFFADNMVLQRDIPIPLWGNAGPYEKIEVQFHEQKKKVKANKAGKWILYLEPEKAGGPYMLSVKGKKTIQIKNVMIGEVWICSGQSNMEWTVRQSEGAKEVIAAADQFFIRHIKIDKEIKAIAQSNLRTTGWQICDSTTVGDFTGVGYFFAKKMYEELKVPIGLINASWGGTNIETWISRDGFEGSKEFKEMIALIPKIALDSLLKLKIDKEYKKIEKLQGFAFDENVDANLYKNVAFNDTSWPELYQPEPWENNTLPGFDGIVWLRKQVLLTADHLNENASLYLSKIDDEDITYVNGIQVGSSKAWDDERNYKIPKGILKEGINSIAVRVIDNGANGGIYGNSKDLKLVLGKVEFPLDGNWKYQIESVKARVSENDFPSLAFNAMINPLIPYAVKGVLWYQGESNESRAFQYNEAFPLLINDWRSKWRQGDMPFYFAQLASFGTKGNSNEGCAWAELREAQFNTLKLNNTAMVVTTDIGNPNDIHPRNKKDVGYRFAGLALNNLYGKNNVCNSPSYKAVQIKEDKVVVFFNDIADGLIATNGSDVKGFEIAANDGVFYAAKACIDKGTVVLRSEKVSNPVAVRFGWVGDASDNNLFNSAGLPAIPFRTDNWKTVTKGEKYKLENMKP